MTKAEKEAIIAEVRANLAKGTTFTVIAPKEQKEEDA